MKVITADFVTSASAGGSVTGIPRDGLAQVAMTGRSNVGKSTLLNALCRSKMARTSAAPGKTRLANIYRVWSKGGGPGKWGLYLVDLPGYGYARGGADAAEELRAVAEAYFSGSDSGSGLGRPDRPAAIESPSPEPRVPNRHALLLVDSRHPGLKADIQAAHWLDAMGVGLPRRRDKDRQTVAHRARAQHEGARTYFRQTAAAGVGRGRRRIGFTVENDASLARTGRA